MSTAAKERRRSRFWLLYDILTALALIGIAAGLYVFRDYIAAYEASQPIHTAETYASSLTESDWETLLKDAQIENRSPYESDETVLDICRDTLRGGEISVRKSAGGSADSPIFALMSGDIAVGTVTLTAAETDRFGFPVWTVSSTSLFPDVLAPAEYSVVIHAPKESIVTLNGTTLGESALVSRDAPYPYFTEFDAGIAGSFCCTYSVSGLRASPEVRCRLGGAECPLFEESREGEMQFLLPEYRTVSVTVPNGTAVIVNGIVLDDRYRTEDPSSYINPNGAFYDVYEAIEAEADDLPYREYYIVHDLLVDPTVTAVRGGAPLPLKVVDGVYQADYPQEELYRCIISVPVGSTVTVRGKDCAVYRQPETEARFTDLYEDPEQAPKWERYVIERLFLAPEAPLVEYNGYRLPTERSEEGRTVTFTADLPRIEDADLFAFAKSFVNAYFTYTSQGFNNTDAHLADVLSFVAPGSDLNNRLRRAKVGIDYVTPVTSDERTLTADFAWVPTENTFICPVRFAVEQNIYSVHRSYSGLLTVLLRRNANGWLVYAMTIEND